MTTFVFPGQGSQMKGMGADLFPLFPNEVNQVDNVLGYSIEKLCVDGPDELLNQTDHTQPAIYVVSALSFLKKMNDGASMPSFTAGHSLGEYNALFAAGVFDLITGLKLVQKRGQLMHTAKGGGMAGVVGLPAETVDKVLKDNNLSNVTIANYNSHTQIVITGPNEEVTKAEPFLVQAGAMLVVPLKKVSGAFHSPFMKQAQDEFSNFIVQFKFDSPKIPVISNVTAQPYQANQLQSNLVNQITSSVHWTQTIDYLMAQGETNFEEIGPGKVLTNLIARIKKGQ